MFLDDSEIRPYEDDEQEDDNDTNITDDEENVVAISEVKFKKKYDKTVTEL